VLCWGGGGGEGAGSRAVSVGSRQTTSGEKCTQTDAGKRDATHIVILLLVIICSNYTHEGEFAETSESITRTRRNNNARRYDRIIIIILSLSHRARLTYNLILRFRYTHTHTHTYNFFLLLYPGTDHRRGVPTHIMHFNLIRRSTKI